jgi:murein DD-endopeptidase MepM/ murein hydrolase activator NlpD
MGLPQLRRVAGSLMDNSFLSQWSNYWKGTFRPVPVPIVAQLQGVQTVRAAVPDPWLQRVRKGRTTFRVQFALALTIVLVGCLFLPRRVTAPIALQAAEPVPVPVPAPSTAGRLSPKVAQAQAPLPVSTASSTRVLPLIPASYAQSQDYPTVEVAPNAPAAERFGSSTLGVLISGALTSPDPMANIDPIYRFLPEPVWSNDFDRLMTSESYGDGLNPTILTEFVSRPPMAGLDATQPYILRTPVPNVGTSRQFVSRPPMGGLTVLRAEIDEARATQSFEVDMGLDTGDSSRTLSGAGSLWPTFVPPHPTSGEHFWLDMPFPSGFNHLYSPGYQFGSTGGGRYRIHHGIDIGNPIGTPVLASASGEVIHAGPDNPALLGPYNDFYGNSVVIRLDRTLTTPRGEQDIYVLYGHLASVEVQERQWVGAGDLLGGVGMTGIAIGPHLHLEVRLGQNSYDHTVNPAMWMRPPAYAGTVVVRLISANGRTWPGVQLTLLRYEEGGTRWFRVIETYPELESIGPDPSWGENGALGNIAAGHYYIGAYVNGEEFGQDITVVAGETTFVELRSRQ